MSGPELPRKRQRSDAGDLKPAGLTREQYAAELKKEQALIKDLAASLPHISTFLTTEIERMSRPEEIGPAQAPAAPAHDATLPWDQPKDETGVYAVLMPDEIADGKQRSSMKVFMPEDTPDGRGSASRGRLLGPQGATLRLLQGESKCKMSLKGKGSVKAREGLSAEALALDPKYSHLHEAFHLLCEYDGAPEGRNQAFAKAFRDVKTVLCGGNVQPSMPAFNGGGFAGADAGTTAFSAGAFGAAPYGAAASYGTYGATNPSDIAYVESATAAGQILSVFSKQTDVGGGSAKTELKIYVPERTPLGCSRGKLLGTRGSMLKQLSAECGCKLFIRGKTSMKIPPGETEDSVIHNPTYAHLREPLHVLVEHEGPQYLATSMLQGAEMLIRSILTPAGDAPPGKYAISQYEAVHQSSFGQTAYPPQASFQQYPQPGAAAAYPTQFDMASAGMAGAGAGMYGYPGGQYAASAPAVPQVGYPQQYIYPQ